MLKVKAHTSRALCQDEPEHIYRRAGNALADLVAKRAAGQHPSCEDTLEKAQKAAILIEDAAKYAARVGLWQLQTYGKQAREASGVVLPVPGMPKPLAVSGHRPTLERLSLRWRCTLCLSSGATLKDLRRYVCQVQATDPQQHCVWSAGECAFCNRCGAYALVRTQALKYPCPGAVVDENRARRLSSLRQGRHPVTRILLGKAQRAHQREEWEMLNLFLQEQLEEAHAART